MLSCLLNGRNGEVNRWGLVQLDRSTVRKVLLAVKGRREECDLTYHPIGIEEERSLLTKDFRDAKSPPFTVRDPDFDT